MTDQDRIDQLEDVLAQFLRPIKNLPFPVVVKALSGTTIEPIDRDSDADRLLIEKLTLTAGLCKQLVDATPIVRNRPNEVGNDVEPFVMRAAQECGLAAVRRQLYI